MIAPAGVAPEVRLLLVGRGLRAFVDGYVVVLLPAYLLALGFGTWEVGLLGSATLLGSALAMLAAALLMTATGLIFAGLTTFWPLLLVAFVGTLNPSSGDVSVFLPLEHARLADAAQRNARTTLFARYSLIGALFAALGSLATAVPEVLAGQGIAQLAALRCMFVLYGGVGLAVWLLYRRLPDPRCLGADPAVGAGPVAGAQRPVADGCTDALRLRHVRGDARRAHGSGQLHRRAAQPGRRSESDSGRRRWSSAGR